MKGSVRKRGKTWSYYFDLGKIDGKRQKKEKGGFATKKEAEAALAKALNEYNTAGLVFEPSEITLSDYLDYWVKEYCEMNCKPNTIRIYSQVIRNHIKPDIGEYKLKAITAPVVQKWLNCLKTKGYSQKYVSLCRDALSGALTYAVNPMQYIKFNPCLYARIPKYDTPPKESRYVIQPEDFKRIVTRYNADTPAYVPLMIGYYTGMRANEVFALTWDDIDLGNRTISVNKTLVPQKARSKGDSPWYFGSPKTKSSKRTITIGETLYKALKTARHKKKLLRMEQGQEFKECYFEDVSKGNGETVRHLIWKKRSEPCRFPLADMVCIYEDGHFYSSEAMRLAISKPINQEMGIKYNFHSLRHTHATMLVESGAPLKSVQERLGHGNIQITMNVYTHNTDSQIKETVDLFEKASGQIL